MTDPGAPVRLDDLLLAVPGIRAVYPPAGVHAVAASIASTVSGRPVQGPIVVASPTGSVNAVIATGSEVRSPEAARAAADVLLAIASPGERVKVRIARVT